MLKCDTASDAEDEGITSSDALVFPMRCEDGSFISTNGYYCIPDVTENPTDRNGWMKGAPQVYFTHAYRKQKKKSHFSTWEMAFFLEQQKGFDRFALSPQGI